MTHLSTLAYGTLCTTVTVIDYYNIYHFSTCYQVPSRKKDMSCGEAMKQFREEVPTLSLLGTVHTVRAEKPYTVNDEVQLVCKYLQAYDRGGVKGIDRLYKEG